MALLKRDIEKLLAAIFKYSDTEILCRSAQEKAYDFVSIKETRGELGFCVRLARSTQELRAAEREIEELFKGAPYSIIEGEPPEGSAARRVSLYMPAPHGKPKVYTLATEEVEKMISSASPPDVQKLYRKLLLARKIEETIPEEERARRWAAGILEHPKINGTYFPTANLKHITDHSHVFLRVNAHVLLNTLFGRFGEDTDLLSDAIKTIEDFGFRRLSFVARGTSTYAFESVKNEEQRGQFILISPSKDEYIPHPLMLPAIKSQPIGDGSLMVRVMPEVEVLTKADPRIAELVQKIEASGLCINVGDSGLEIRPHNVGIYTYTDENGKTESVAMILDWGAVSWPPETTPDEKKAMIQQWENNPAFEPWRKAQQHMAKEAQNVYRAEQLETLRKTTGAYEAERKFYPGVLVSALEEGLYPKELGALSRIARKAAQKGKGDYHEILGELVNRYDKSQSPDTPRFR